VFIYLEYAGEIKDAFPHKKVTIVHSDSQLLNSAYPDKYRKRVEKDITSRGIKIIFSDYVDDFESLPASTRSGGRLEGDLVVRSFWVILPVDSFVYRSPLLVAAPELTSLSRSARMCSIRVVRSRSSRRSSSSHTPIFMRLVM
jgi:Pyridine nucleotide-disulphide oxidoreductase